MIGHVFDRVERPFPHVDRIALHLVHATELIVRNSLDDNGTAFNDILELRQQLRGRASLRGGELRIAISPKLLTPDPGDDPLRQVATQVQDQVGDAVGTGSRTPPQLFFVEVLDTNPDLVEVLA